MNVAISQMKAVRACQNVEETRSVLDSPPEALLTAWRENLTQITTISSSTASRAHRLLEILIAVAVEISIEDLIGIYARLSANDHNATLKSSGMDAVEVMDLCSNFLTLFIPDAAQDQIDYGSQRIELVHPWLRRFLLSDSLSSTVPMFPRISETKANMTLARSCLQDLLEKVSKQHSFSKYSARCWFIHVKRTLSEIHSDHAISRLMWRLFDSEDCFAAWLAVYDPDRDEGRMSHLNPPSPLYYACLLGFYRLAERLIAHSAPIGVGGGKYTYPFLAALESGQPDVVQLLLDNGDDANRRFDNGDTGLIRAASKDNTYMVELLLEYGVRPGLPICFIRLVRLTGP